MHATAPCSASALAQAHPTMSYIPLVAEHIRVRVVLTKYVCKYVRGGSCSGMSRGMSLHTIGVGAPCILQSDMLNSDKCS